MVKKNKFKIIKKVFIFSYIPQLKPYNEETSKQI